MIGIVVVSHSRKLAEGVFELAKMMAPTANISVAGGLEDGSMGTSFAKISQAIDEVYSDDGVVVLMDMGSAVMTTEMVIESMEGGKIKMLDCPIVEGAIVAALESMLGATMEELEEKVAETCTMKKINS